MGSVAKLLNNASGHRLRLSPLLILYILVRSQIVAWSMEDFVPSSWRPQVVYLCLLIFIISIFIPLLHSFYVSLCSVSIYLSLSVSLPLCLKFFSFHVRPAGRCVIFSLKYIRQESLQSTLFFSLTESRNNEINIIVHLIFFLEFQNLFLV